MEQSEMLNFKTQFLELIKIGKQMKKSIIKFQDRILLGTDDTVSTLSILYYDDQKYDLFKLKDFFGVSITFRVNELLAYLKINDIMKPNYIINNYGIFDMESKMILENEEKISREISNMQSRCLFYMQTSQHNIESYNLKEDDTFANILNLKTKDGSVLYNLDNRYFMSTFSSIHPVTKSDQIILDIYDKRDSNDFLSKFTITKKNCMIEEFIKYRKL